jgi:hypothetical protein
MNILEQVPWHRFGQRLELRPLAPGGASAVLLATDALEALPIGHDAVKQGCAARLEPPF